jgi:serine O-acetyltransferase
MTRSAASNALRQGAPAPPERADFNKEAQMIASTGRKFARAPVTDLIWERLQEEAQETLAREPQFATLLHLSVLEHASFEEAVIQRIALRVEHPDLPAEGIRRAYREALAADSAIGQAIRADIQAVFERDPAVNRYLEPLLYFKGFHALQVHRLAHWLWSQGRYDFALYLQSRASEVLQVDMHPAVPIGRGLFFDHATGIVVGETAVIEDDVSILQSVTLGGSGRQARDRHPKVRRGVLIGSGAKLIGNIEVGEGARIGAGSVVTDSVPPHKTVAGVPARVIGAAGTAEPGRSMNQIFFDVGL